LNNTAIIIPCYNEEKNIGQLLREIKTHVSDADPVVIDDGSIDRTGAEAREAGAVVLRLAHNLGVGGAVQAGFIYCFNQGYKKVVRIDGDGQHPPEEIQKLLEAIDKQDVDMVIGSRFLGKGEFTSTAVRFLGIKSLSLIMSVICRKKVTDPTSGFFAVNRKLLYYFSHRYPEDYPEPEALALLRRQGYDFIEVGVKFRKRLHGNSTIRKWGTFYYALKVGLALFVGRVRPVDRRFARHAIYDNI
jgi:glycosyltransferase involved in cell wall biosynthesis